LDLRNQGDYASNLKIENGELSNYLNLIFAYFNFFLEAQLGDDLELI
jgi:hypothetical protein